MNIRVQCRGMGLDSSPGCFVCKQHGPRSMLDNSSMFVGSFDDGVRVLQMFGTPLVFTEGKVETAGAFLDFRPREPSWIQVKVGACSDHARNLSALVNRLFEMRDDSAISAEMVDDARNRPTNEGSA